MLIKLKKILTLIKFSHTIFAMPFALGAFIVATNGTLPAILTSKILIALITARTSAMLFNRLADWETDKLNPRTAGRHKLASRKIATSLLVISTILFLATCWSINALCFYLSPLALSIIFLYSLTKRFTNWTQIFLGLALALAPLGAWIAVLGNLNFQITLLAFGVIFWVAGFDIIYATLDEEFDKKMGFRSLVIKFSDNKVITPLRLALIFHVIAIALMLAFGTFLPNKFAYLICFSLTVPIFVFEHHYAKKQKPEQINQAFFQANSAISLIFITSCILGIYLR